MSSVLAIVSKAVFEKLAAGAQVGTVVATDSYASLHKSLDALADGGSLFLVTVRPPDEQLWLVAVLEQPKRGTTGWSARANVVPITNVSALRSKLVFATGTGIQAKPGALGMSLQTPRGLTEADEALLRGAAGKTAKAPKAAKPGKAAGSKATSSKATGSKATSSKATSSKATSSKATSSKATSSKATSSKAAGSKAAGSKAAGSKAAGSKAASSKAASLKAVSSKATSSKAAGSKATSSKATSSKATSSKATSSKATSSKATSSKAAGSKAAGSKSSKTLKASKASSENPGAIADLGPLEKAVAAKDGAAALLAALEAWRMQRSTSLATVIDDISKRVSGKPVTDQNSFTKLAMAKNPLDLGRLLPAVTELQVNFLPTVAEMLSAYPDDPRISQAFSTWVIEPITTSLSKQAFWSKMFAKVQQIGDTRLVRTLNKRLGMKHWTQSWWDTYYNHLRKTVAKLEALPAVAPIKFPKLAINKLAPIAATAVVAAKPATEKVPKLSGPLLAQAATHFAAGRTVAAIEAMVAHWRTSRIPALADLIDRATRLLPTFDRPLPPMQQGGSDPWLEAFDADPALHMPQLLQKLGLADAARAKLQIAQIATLPDDPRISYRLAELGNRRVSNKEAQYWKTLFETMARHRDVRTIPVVRHKFEDFLHTYFYEVRHAKRFMGKFVFAPETAFDSWPLVFDAADQKLFDKLAAQVEAAVTKAESRERALIARIAEDWKSSGPREVYADWLMEREHPRGELLMLACEKKRSPAETERFEELKKQRYLFGAIEDLQDDEVELDRGLYREIKLEYSTTTLCWRSAAASPLVALIETLELGADAPLPDDFAAFVATATSLRKIAGCSRASIAHLDPDHEKHWKVVGTGRNQHVLRIGR